MDAKLSDYKDLKLKLDGLVLPATASIAICCSMRSTARCRATRR
jgi:hypothetical protein